MEGNVVKFSHRKLRESPALGGELVPKRVRTDMLESNLNKKLREGHGVMVVASWLRP